MTPVCQRAARPCMHMAAHTNTPARRPPCHQTPPAQFLEPVAPTAGNLVANPVSRMGVGSIQLSGGPANGAECGLFGPCNYSWSISCGANGPSFTREGESTTVVAGYNGTRDLDFMDVRDFSCTATSIITDSADRSGNADVTFKVGAPAPAGISGALTEWLSARRRVIRPAFLAAMAVCTHASHAQLQRRPPSELSCFLDAQHPLARQLRPMSAHRCLTEFARAPRCRRNCRCSSLCPRPSRLARALSRVPSRAAALSR